MTTYIHTTKKLEKLIKGHIAGDVPVEESDLGRWHATVFYINRVKCWLLTHKATMYNVLLPNVKAADVKRIDELFRTALADQLRFDGIAFDHGTLEQRIGQLAFLPTDNDRKTLGFQNQRLFELSLWYDELETLEKQVILQRCNFLNNTPIQLGPGRGLRDYVYSSNEMRNAIGRKPFG